MIVKLRKLLLSLFFFKFHFEYLKILFGAARILVVFFYNLTKLYFNLVLAFLCLFFLLGERWDILRAIKSGALIRAEQLINKG